MEKEKWQWQGWGTAWKGIGIYHVTMTIPSREPLLGKLVIPENDPKQAKVELSEIGVQIKSCVDAIPVCYPEIRIIQLRMMPDHLHVILYVTKSMPISIKMVVRGLWQGAKKVDREHTTSVSPHNMRDNKRSTPLFTEMPFIRPLSRKGQLQTMIRYVQMNPQRLATKQLKPGFFHVQEGIEIGARKYSGVGNVALLQAAHYMPVHVRRKMVEEAAHGQSQALRDYMNSCVAEARKGTVMVSPFISPDEKRVMEVLLKEKKRFVLLADNGFRDYYKPSDGIFDAVAEGRVLILSPWEDYQDRKKISREDCIALNGMAEDICAALNHE